MMRFVLLVGIAVTALGASAAMPFGPRAVAGVVGGGAWAMANFIALLLAARVWIDSKEFGWKGLLWFAVKFPLLYGSAWLILKQPGCSPAGFAAGFTLVLVVAGIAAATRLQPNPVKVSHGR